MKTSLAWLQTYFAEPLPHADAVRDALTFHSSEVEEMEPAGNDMMLDVKILPDRAGYALCHRGIARELGAALNLPLAKDPLHEPPFLASDFSADGLSITIDDTRCSRYMAARINGVTIGPSPAWLVQALEAVGQRSINNVVDATNYVMLNIGQPLHAFDADVLADSAGSVSIAIRESNDGERITTLGGGEYALPVGTMLITNGATHAPLAVAGIKGGTAAAVTETTTSIVLESACFAASPVRRTAQTLKLFTDASTRYQNGVSPELAAYGMRDVVALVVDIAGGRVAAATDCYPAPVAPHAPVSVSITAVSQLLGMPLTASDVNAPLTRLDLSHTTTGDIVTVTPPFERSDIQTVADVAEEVGRIIGYDHIAPEALPAPTTPPSQTAYTGYERIKDWLLERGFAEISSPSFAETGDIRLANPLQADKPYLRSSLMENMQRALARAREYAPLTLGPDPYIKLFELGTVFTEAGEFSSLCIAHAPVQGTKGSAALAQTVQEFQEAFGTYGVTLPHTAPITTDTATAEFLLTTYDALASGEGYSVERPVLTTFTPYSLYPFATRDVAVWVPNNVEESEISITIVRVAGPFTMRIDCFDRFEKDDRTSYAFRIVFQSFERTLTDTDLDAAMAAVHAALRESGWEVR